MSSVGILMRFAYYICDILFYTNLISSLIAELPDLTCEQNLPSLESDKDMVKSL